MNNHQLLEILAQSNCATAIYATEKIIIEFANEAMLAFWGKNKQIIGLPLEEGVPELKGQPFKQMLQKVWDTGITDSGVIPAETNIDGVLQTHFYEYEYRAIKGSSGEIYGILHTAANVTDKVMRKHAVELAAETEARFRSMAENSGILIAVADEMRNAIYISKAWTELTGVAGEALLSFGWTDIIHPDDRQHILDLYDSAFKKHDPFFSEFRILNYKKEYRWLLAKAFPRFLPNGKFAGYISSCMDITPLKEAERRKDDFISIASHELKTPLTSLKGSLQLLDRIKDNPVSKKFPHLVTQANKSMDKITRLIEDLLNFSRASEGQLPLKKNTFNVAEMLNRCCNHVRAEGKYNLVLQGDKQLQVYADEDRIEQVVVNLVNNAVKYAPGSNEIFLKVEDLGVMARISVTDKGPGIPEEQIPYLFERYYRADYSGIKYSGLGLGLYISSEIIKRHGGKIGVDTEFGKGTTFWFSLPLK